MAVPDDFQNLMGLSMSSDTSLAKFSGRSDQFFQRYEPILQLRRILQKIPRSRFRGRCLPKSNPFFLIQRYISGKIFIKICSVFLCKVANRKNTETNRKKNDARYYTLPWCS